MVDCPRGGRDGVLVGEEGVSGYWKRLVVRGRRQGLCSKCGRWHEEEQDLISACIIEKQ